MRKDGVIYLIWVEVFFEDLFQVNVIADHVVLNQSPICFLPEKYLKYEKIQHRTKYPCYKSKLLSMDEPAATWCFFSLESDNGCIFVVPKFETKSILILIIFSDYTADIVFKALYNFCESQTTSFFPPSRSSNFV